MKTFDLNECARQSIKAVQKYGKEKSFTVVRGLLEEAYSAGRKEGSDWVMRACLRDRGFKDPDD